MKRKIFKCLTVLSCIIIILTIWSTLFITKSTENFVTDDINKIQATEVGLLLGTSKYLKNGNNNLFFFNRIDAAMELYNAGKIKFLIISGDNSKDNYNEPLDMQTELIRRGFPQEKIFLDYAGFRTFDSVIRAREIFGQISYIVISQKFHNERAVFIARKNEIEAYGYNAKDVTAFNGFRTKTRELLARDKVFLDMLFKVKPKFLGERVMVK